ncbi:hypothetical protein [Phenylobacterium sp.]|uniref:phosphorylase family protein n=1 Tax=Phenylobacterium sp. TaxID=1871053 RepID=UPI00286BE3F5|nr:hypothetical protein [Phenylobacterium sp.]
MRPFLPLLALLALFAAVAGAARAAPGGRLDDQSRTAVVSAFAPELAALTQATTHRRAVTLGGTLFTTGLLEGKPVVLFLSGVSMVNAAMTTQRALDRFHVRRIVFSGIAGGGRSQPRRRRRGRAGAVEPVPGERDGP